MPVQVQIEGVERTIRNLGRYQRLISLSSKRNVVLLGDDVVRQLSSKFPELKISGQYFDKNNEYWISFQAEGKTLKWIKCPTSNLFYTRKRIEGSQEFRSDVNELNVPDVPKLAKQIADELSKKIRISIREILK